MPDTSQIERREEMLNMQKRLEEGDARMKRIEESIAEILDIIQAAKGFFKVLGLVGTTVKWLAGLGTAAVVVYNIIFHPPKV
jgi:hypothetical protein